MRAACMRPSSAVLTMTGLSAWSSTTLTAATVGPHTSMNMSRSSPCVDAAPPHNVLSRHRSAAKHRQAIAFVAAAAGAQPYFILSTACIVQGQAAGLAWLSVSPIQRYGVCRCGWAERTVDGGIDHCAAWRVRRALQVRPQQRRHLRSDLKNLPMAYKPFVLPCRASMPAQIGALASESY